MEDMTGINISLKYTNQQLFEERIATIPLSMEVSQKYANRRFGGMNMVTCTKRKTCQHKNGWYTTVQFWIFSKRVFVCSDCGENMRVHK